MGVAALSGRTAGVQERSNTLRIESDGGGIAAYELEVSGSLRQKDAGDRVDAGRAYGHVGPDRGADAFSYAGEITGLALAGPASAYRNGIQVRPEVYPAPDGSVTAADFPHGSETKRLRVESDGGGFAAYEFEATGEVAQLDSGDRVAGDRAAGHVGPERGADEFEATGDLTRFALAGPATVSVDGRAVTAESSDGRRAAVRMSPVPEITARPETTLVFEARADGYRGEYAEAAWYVDGERRYEPDAFYGQLGGRDRCAFTHAFGATGTHSVRAELYDQGRAREDDPDADPVGTVEWTVRVESDGNRPPTVERVAPSADAVATSRDAPERTAFEVAASDPDGSLDRVVWWLSQCDKVVAVSPLSGAQDSAAVSFAPEPGCPFGAWAIDESGAMSEFAYWNVEEK